MKLKDGSFIVALKRCPFCGKAPNYEKYYPFDGYQGEDPVHIITCDASCGCYMKGLDLIRLVARWNSRVKVVPNEKV